MTVKRRLPQRFLLEPVLFNIFIKDINYVILNVTLLLYADDATDYFSDNSTMVLEFMINGEMRPWEMVHGELFNNKRI